MNDNKRCAIAFICGRLIIHSDRNYIYDYLSGYKNYSGVVSKERISIYDYQRNSYVSGSPHSLYDYDSHNYVSLKISGTQINGFDYETNSYFHVNIIGKSIYLYDYQKNRYYNYSL